jgi:hypothetical protein
MTSSFDNIKSYINNAKKLPSGVKSKNNVKRGLEDPTLKLKLSFFSYISGLVEPFLRKYQTSKPMIPFLYEDLDKLLRNLLSKFVKKEFTDVRTSILLKLNFSDDKILCSLNKIDVGFGVVKFLKSDKVTEKDKLLFLQDCRKIYTDMAKKILKRPNLKYELVKHLSCQIPQLTMKKRLKQE